MQVAFTVVTQKVFGWDRRADIFIQFRSVFQSVITSLYFPRVWNRFDTFVLCVLRQIAQNGRKRIICAPLWFILMNYSILCVHLTFVMIVFVQFPATITDYALLAEHFLSSLRKTARNYGNSINEIRCGNIVNSKINQQWLNIGGGETEGASQKTEKQVAHTNKGKIELEIVFFYLICVWDHFAAYIDCIL